MHHKFNVLSYQKLFSVFEPGEDEGNEEEYKKIHEEYKNLVRRHLNKP
jgi:The ARF-like 2 binding protein BART